MDTRLFSRIVAKSVASRPLIIPFSQSAQPARHFFRKRRSMKEAHHLKSWHGPGSYSAMNPVITYTPLRIREWQCNIHYLYGLLWINVVNPMIKHLAWCKMTLDSLLLGLPHCRYFHFCSLLYCQKKCISTWALKEWLDYGAARFPCTCPSAFCNTRHHSNHCRLVVSTHQKILILSTTLQGR